MPSSSKRDFHVYRAQLIVEKTLFPSSEGITDRADFLRTVLIASMSQKRPAGASRWAVAELQTHDGLESNYLVGQIVHLKRRRHVIFEPDTLHLAQGITEDADTLTFIFDGKDEYFALEASTQIDDRLALGKLRALFNNADFFIRSGRQIEFSAVKSADNAFDILAKHHLAKFSAKLRKPNGEVDYALEELFRPIEKGTNAEEVDVTWKSASGQLKIGPGSAIWNAITMVSASFGSWRAWPVKGEAGSPIVSDETPLTVRINLKNTETMLSSIRRAFTAVSERLVGIKNPEILFTTDAPKAIQETQKILETRQGTEE